jgi:DNA-3-methyladenine glycosylase
VDAVGPPLPRAFFDRDVLVVAGDLLGCVLRADGVAVRLTEVEAYRGADDPASHAYRGPTARNAVMFGPGGHLYVYFTYGLHHCVNVVCGPPEQAAAVLLRAGEVIAGQEIARARRPGVQAASALARGPANLVRALGLGPEHNGLDVCGDGAVSVHTAQPEPGERVLTGPRVGVRRAAERPWRFWLAGEPSVSAYRPAAPRPGRFGQARPVGRR